MHMYNMFMYMLHLLLKCLRPNSADQTIHAVSDVQSDIKLAFGKMNDR